MRLLSESDVRMKRIVLAVIGCVVIIGLTIGVISRTSTVIPDKPAQSKQTGSGLDAVRDALRRGADFEACRTAVQQLNSYLARNPGEGSTGLTEAQQKILTERYHLDSGEMTEVGSRVFTPLDTNYLESCFLLADSLRSLKVDSDNRLDQIQAAFAWIVREVRLREQEVFLLPPRFVLSRGWGSSLERATVFSEVADLLGIDACMVAVPFGSQEERGLRYWIPGALIDGQIYLFDSRMGMPIPGPGGHGVATLSQARSQPAILGSLTVNAEFPYDVNAETLKQAEVHVAGSLSMLAPRMRFLQDLMSASDKINISVEPVGLMQRFEKALEAPDLKGVSLHVWNHPGELKTPFRALRNFLPQEEGGTDKSSPSLRQLARRQLIPFNLLPPEIMNMPGEIGARLRSLYADPFYTFYVESKASRTQLQAWMPGLVDAPSRSQDPKSEENTTQRKDAELVLRGRLPRELMLRGRFDEAGAILATMEGELRRQRQEMRSQPNLLAVVRAWCLRAVDFYGSVVSAENAVGGLKGKSSPVRMSPEEKREKETSLMEDAHPVTVLIQGTAAGPLIGDVIYFLALCKQEQAERLQWHVDYETGRGKAVRSTETKTAQKAWESASGWWNTYLGAEIPMGTPGAARTNLAQARSCLGDKAGARTLLNDLAGELTPLEKTGRLYRAKQIK
jgi:hypothetical protein